MPSHPSTYLDAASGAPLHPVAGQALLAALDDGWADPARLSGAGRRAASMLQAARESMSASLGARPDELSFRRRRHAGAARSGAGHACGCPHS